MARRRWRFLAEGAAFGLLALAVGSAHPARARVRAEGFHAPLGEQVLTRVLRRQLGDGAMLVVTRRYAVRFTADGDGYRVDGRQVDVKVDAPSRLAPLAAIERARPDEAMFPMRLDREGYIVAFPELPTGGGDGTLERSALRAVEHTIAGSPIAEGDRQQAVLLARMMAERVTLWPRDLFRPGSASSETRAFALPGGEEGQVTIAINANTDGAVMSQMERIVSTSTGGQTRVNTEVWRLERELR